MNGMNSVVCDLACVCLVPVSCFLRIYVFVGSKYGKLFHMQGLLISTR